MKRRVLVICTENACRSQMAEALLRTLAGDRFDVTSAGVEPAAVVNPDAVAVMGEIGIDISTPTPQAIGTSPRPALQLRDYGVRPGRRAVSDLPWDG